MFTAGNLSGLFREQAIGPADCAHVCVDVQECYAEPDVAKHIARSIAPAFRDAGIRNYWVHLSCATDAAGMPMGAESFCEVVPAPGEDVVQKKDTCAFRGSNIGNRLKARDTKLILLTGFTFEVCVLATATGARDRGYPVVVMTDGINQCLSFSGRAVMNMLNRGILFANSADFLRMLTASNDHAIKTTGNEAGSQLPPWLKKGL